MFEKKRPLIALPVDDKNIDDVLEKAKKEKIDIIELRIDQFSNLDIDYIIEQSKKVKGKGFYLLATVRSKEEGGTDIPDEERFEIFSEIVNFADILDIELTSEKINKDVINLTKKHEKLSLVSYHDFEKTPPEEEIQEIIDRANSLNPDIIKYAFNVRTFEDVGRIMSITHKNRDKKLVAIGMGELGKITRVAGYFFGSLISYTFIGKSFAPGQIEAEKLIEEMKFYGLLDN